MKFAVQLSVVVAVLVFIISAYKVAHVSAQIAVVHSVVALAPQVESAEQHLPVSGEILDNTVATSTPATESFAPPHTSAPLPAAEQTQHSSPATPGVPVHLSIPAAGIEAPVIKVGLNSKGEMDVPSGTSNNVGWYSPGTTPGNVGSAVLDAHVFAALKNLHKASVGDDIYIDTAAGGRLHFRVESTKVYGYKDVPNEVLFNRADQPRLNLITCAGTFVPSLDTYDHRLVVYAVLVS